VTSGKNTLGSVIGRKNETKGSVIRRGPNTGGNAGVSYGRYAVEKERRLGKGDRGETARGTMRESEVAVNHYWGPTDYHQRWEMWGE